MWKLLRNLCLVAILLAGVLKLAAWYVAGQAVQRAVAALTPYAQIKYSGVSAGLDGSIDLSDVAIAPAGTHHLYRADNVSLDSPGLYWLLTQGLSHSQQLPPTFRIGVRGLKLPAGLPWLKSQWIDAATFVPFPAVGCGKSELTGSDYLKMGVNAGTAHERVDYRYDARAHSLDLVLSLTAPGFSRVVLEAELSNFDPAALATAALRDKLHVDQLSVDYSDLGYLQRRTRFCAEHIGIAPKQFIARHLTSVQELLKQNRIVPSDELLQLYRKLLVDGGKASILSLPSPNFFMSTWRNSAPEEVLRQLNVTARYQDAPPIMFRLAFAPAPDAATPDVTSVAIDAVPANLPGGADKPASVTVPTVVVIPPLPVPAPEPRKPIAATIPTATPTVVNPAAPTSDRTAKLPAARSDSLFDKLDRAAANYVTKSEPRHSEPAPALPQAQAPVLASAPPPPPNSTLALVWKNTVEDLPENTPEERDYKLIEFGQLAGEVGRRVRLITEGGKLVDGYVVSADAGGVQLRVMRNGGDAQFEVPKTRIRQIQLLKR